jgi:hypothetical protein
LKNFPNSLFFKSFSFALLYGLFFYIIQFFLVKTDIFKVLPDSTNLLSWDASYYDSIVKKGYIHASHNTGFLVLFPLIWKISHLGVWGISLLNIIFFAVGFAILMHLVTEKEKNTWLLLLTLPPVFYAFIPLTEALFFLLGALSMYAIKEKKFWWLWCSLFLISLVRSFTIFILPALLAMELITHNSRQWFKSFVSFLYKYCIPSLTGLSLFIYWQYRKTGIWFAYFKKQAEHWEKEFSIPEFPLSNIEGGYWRYHWLSAISMFIALVAFCIFLKQLLLWVKGKVYSDGNLIYSIVFLSMVFIFILFFNPKYGESHTNVMGANRYIIITPFCFYFIIYLLKHQVSCRGLLFILIGANLFWALFNGFTSLNGYLTVGLIPTLMITSFILYTNSGYKKHWLLTGIVAFNFLIQLHFFQKFIEHNFMD